MTLALAAVGARSAPFPTFSLHPAAWSCILVAAAAYALLIRTARFAVTKRQAWSFLGSLGVLLVGFTWPLADLATRSLLLGLVAQRLLLLLAVPPLLLLGLPAPLVARVTRPAALDAVARVVSRPVPAVAIVTAVAVGTLTVPAVDAQASSLAVRGVLDVVLLGAGIVLWSPVLRPAPGSRRIPAMAVAGYLVVQSILPGFLSVVWIFARHPLYAPYAHAGHVLGLSPVADQQVSGFVAKLVTIAVLWTVAFTRALRAERLSNGGDDGDALTWADVERDLERVARKERRAAPGRGRRG